MSGPDMKEQAAWPAIDPKLLNTLLDLGLNHGEVYVDTVMQAAANLIAARAVHLNEDPAPRLARFELMVSECTRVNVEAATAGRGAT